jgi:hypothetical protein
MLWPSNVVDRQSDLDKYYNKFFSPGSLTFLALFPLGSGLSLATVDSAALRGNLASLVDPSVPSPSTPLGVMVWGGEPGPSAGGPA